MSTAEANSVQTKRQIKAPRERVFAAWTNQDQIAKWMGPGVCRVLSAKLDVRVGGKYRMLFQTPGGEMTVSGEYRELQAPSKIAFTWQWQDDEDWQNVTSLVTVELVEKDGGTEVTLTHTGLPSGESAGRHEHGWQGSLEKLAIGFDVAADLCGPGRVGWNELLTTDVAAARTFYTALFGWETTEMPGLKGPYTLFKKGGTEVAGMMAHPAPGAPAQWLAYVVVESADAKVAEVIKLGGKTCAGPMDIPNVGRIAMATDPQGATFGIFQPVK
jgi:uncharacterized protein